MDFNNWNIGDIFSFIGKTMVITIGAILATTVVISLLEGLVAFASTGVGAVILILVGYSMYKKHKSE